MNTQANTRAGSRLAAPLRVLLAVPLLSAGALGLAAVPAAAVTVSTEGDLRAAFLDANETEITLDADIALANCALGSLKRNSATDLVINGSGHVIDQTCAGTRVMRSDGNGALTLVGVTITGGQAAAGTAGGVLAQGDVTLDGATFDANSAGFAGALFTNGSIEIANSTFTNNSSGANAGAVNADGAVTVSGSTFKGNSSGSYGGAINTNTLVISDSEFIDNTAEAGGAVASSGTVDVSDSVFTGNTATNGAGGAIRGGPTSTVTVTGGEFTANTTSENGGAIYAQDTSSLSVSGAMFTANQAPTGDGGAVATVEDVEVSNAKLTDNDAGALGGAVYSDGEASIYDSELSGNVGKAAAGAIYAVGEVTVEGSTLTANIVDASGGGAVQSGSGSVGLTDSVLTDNIAGIGGAVWAPVGQVFVVRSTLTDNYAFAGSGGAISAGDAVSVEASTLSGNEAFTNGGAIRAGAGVVALTNSTVSGNKTSQDGGGLWVDGSVDLRHVTLAGNVAAAGGNLYIENGAASLTSFGSVLGESNTDSCVVAAGATSSAGFNVADDASCGFSDTSDEQAAGDLQLATLADNGGPTMTHLPAATSPLVDVIPSGDCDGAVDTDQRGTDRPQGDGCDVGAVELVPEDPEPDGQSGGGSGPGGGPDTGDDPGSAGGTNSGDKQSSGADEEPKANDGDSDETATPNPDSEAGVGVVANDETSPDTGTSVVPFLIAAGLLLAAGLSLLLGGWWRKRRDEKRRRVEPATQQIPRLSQ